MGSGGRARTYDQSVNIPGNHQHLQVLSGDLAVDRHTQPESPESRAQELLRRVAAGEEIDAESMHGLAAAVLAQPEVVLALQVLAGSEHALDRAIELAAVVSAAPVGQAANKPRVT